MWENRPRVADWFTRIKARPSFKAIADYPPCGGYDDTGASASANPSLLFDYQS